jgi:hypothetical protein
MAPAVRSLVAVRYYRDRDGWDSLLTRGPTWQDVARAVTRMEDWCWPIVILSCRAEGTADEIWEDEHALHLVGGAGRFALFQMMGEWRYLDPDGSTAEARLWQSDQGYSCADREVLTDLDAALRLARGYFESGSYRALDRLVGELLASRVEASPGAGQGDPER